MADAAMCALAAPHGFLNLHMRGGKTIDSVLDLTTDAEPKTDTITDMHRYLDTYNKQKSTPSDAYTYTHTDADADTDTDTDTETNADAADTADGMAFSFGPQTQVPFATTTAAFAHFARGQPSLVAVQDLSLSSSAGPDEAPTTLTYGQLAAQAQSLARHLRRGPAGVRPCQRVPLVARRGRAMVVAIWAVLLCGAQYVPLDGGVVPDATLAHVLAESGDGGLLLCTAGTEGRVRRLFPSAHVVVVEEHVGDGDGVEGGNRSHDCDDQDSGQDANSSKCCMDNDEYKGLETAGGQKWMDLATPQSGCYVIYTSGTTGKPKGVDVTHANVTNLVCQYPGNIGIRPGTRVGQVLNISFDMAAWEIFCCLCNGGTLVIRGSDWDATLKQIDVLICTPSILSRYTPADYPNIRVVATAGEPTTQALADLWARNAEYWNCCGPTETTIVNTMSKHVPGRPVTIGCPTPNNNVYILDANRRPVARGQSGVMWAGGTGVSRGYIGLEKKTREVYVEDPFANDGSRMYCTGDLGLWEPCGNIRILGRCDDQVKIKGFRVELDGVSSSLLSIPGIKQAVVQHLDGKIHAFVATDDHHDEAAILDHVAARQPYYALPSSIHQLARFPVTVNGKTDKKALATVYQESKKKNQQQLQIMSPALQERLRKISDCSTLVESNLELLQEQPPDMSTAMRTSVCSTLIETSSVSSAVTFAATNTTATIATPFIDPFATTHRALTRAADTTTAALEKVMTTTTMMTKSALDGDIPEKQQPQPFRGLRHRIMIVYRTLFTLVSVTNAAILILLLFLLLPRKNHDYNTSSTTTATTATNSVAGSAAGTTQFLGLLAAANLTLGVLVRQDMVINLLYTVVCSVPRSAPIWIRSRCARIYHLGGVHSAAGVCATLWLVGSAVLSTVSLADAGAEAGRYALASVVMTWLTCALCAVMMGFAYPAVRKIHHNLFERTHRFMGWTALLFFWMRAILQAADAADTSTSSTTMGRSLAHSPAFWLLVVATASVASSWLLLRRVPVEAVPLSDHAAVLGFTYTKPVNGTFVRVSTRPLLEWHSFATIPQPEPRPSGSDDVLLGPPAGRGYSLIVSNAGDWTGACVGRPPRTLWVRGVPTCGVMRIATLFSRIVVVATGSGIGPLLGHLQRPTCATRLLWSAKDPAATFGSRLLESIARTVPDSVVHDTAVSGRPDLTRMAYNMAVSFAAEAVIIIANEKVTKKVVYGLETRGVPAYGAIWDS